MRPVPLSRSWMMESAVTLLPQPDSPTSPTVSPSSIPKLTPLTARISPSLVKNDVRSPFTRKSGTLWRNWPGCRLTDTSLPKFWRALMDKSHASVDDCHVDLNILDPLRLDGERILGQHGEICKLAR